MQQKHALCSKHPKFQNAMNKVLHHRPYIFKRRTLKVIKMKKCNLTNVEITHCRVYIHILGILNDYTYYINFAYSSNLKDNCLELLLGYLRMR